EEVGDDRIVCRDMGECLGRQRSSALHIDPSRLEPGNDDVVVTRRDDWEDMQKILCRGSNHCRAANVDHLYGVLQRDRRIADGGLKRIEVTRHESDGDYLVFGKGLNVLRLVETRQQSSMDSRMQRLYPAVENLWEPGDVRH